VSFISELKSDHKNARRRTDRSSELIKESLQRYGAARSIVIDEENRILAGNGTIDGAKAAGIKNLRIIETDGDEIIAVKRTGLTEEQKVGLALADNRTADLSEWDQEMLHQLSEEHDISPWFDQDDLDELLAVTELEPEEGNTDPDDVPEPPEDPITKPGDLWILGNHRLLCGDSTNPQHVERLMDGKKADMVFTDPPYGFNYTKKSDGTSIQNDGAEFEQIISDALSCVSVDTAYVCGDAKTAGAFLRATSSLGNPKNCIVWVKPIQHRMHRYEPCHEFIWYWGDNGSPFYGSNVFEAKREIHKFHPTVKPVELVEYCIDSHKDKKVVLDFFGGSGSTLIACERQHRNARLMELDPAYCDVIVKRWEDFTGNTAICEPSAAHFDQEELKAKSS
jgi:DNA modification methylase